MKAGDKQIRGAREHIKLVVFLIFVTLGLGEVSFGPGGWPIVSTSAQDSKKTVGVVGTISGQKSGKPDAAMSSIPAADDKKQEPAMEGDQLTPKSPAAFDPDWKRPYLQYQSVGKDLVLFPYPRLAPGDIPPVDLYRYGGPGASSYASVADV